MGIEIYCPDTKCWKFVDRSIVHPERHFLLEFLFQRNCLRVMKNPPLWSTQPPPHAPPPKDITAQNQVMTQQHHAPRVTSQQSQATPQQQHAQPPKDITAQNQVMTQQHHAPRVTSQQ